MPQLGGALDPSQDLTVAANIAATRSITTSSATSGDGIGLTTGAGGVVTQATSKSTGVTLNRLTGAITMNNAQLATVTAVSAVVTNSMVAATDTIILNHASAGTAGSYLVSVSAVAAGSFTATVYNCSAGNLSEAIVLRFFVLKSVSA